MIACLMSQFLKIRVSSAYYKLMNFIVELLGSPSIHLDSAALDNILFKPSATSTNRSGDNRFPCLRTHLHMISFPASPLTTTFTMAEESQLTIHDNHFGPKLLNLKTFFLSTSYHMPFRSLISRDITYCSNGGIDG